MTGNSTELPTKPLKRMRPTLTLLAPSSNVLIASLSVAMRLLAPASRFTALSMETEVSRMNSALGRLFLLGAAVLK